MHLAEPYIRIVAIAILTCPRALSPQVDGVLLHKIVPQLNLQPKQIRLKTRRARRVLKTTLSSKLSSKSRSGRIPEAMLLLLAAGRAKASL